MISSCDECKTKCCRSGPGPYRSVSVRDWLGHTQKGSKRYNTKCEHFDEDSETCKVWDTKLPVVCATYVCGIRTYSKDELEKIDRVVELMEKANGNRHR